MIQSDKGFKKRRFKKGEIIKGFLQKRKTIQTENLNSNTVVSYPDNYKTLTDDSIILVGYGCGKIPSIEFLEVLVGDAEEKEYGFSVIPNYGKYDTVLAVKAARVKDLSNDPSIWLDTLLSTSREVYMEAVRSKRYEKYINIENEELAAVEVNFPTSVVLEITNICNLDCPFCPRAYRNLNETLMPATEVKSTISKLVSASNLSDFVLYPHYLGETFIHPKIMEILKHACSFSNITVNPITNGFLLDDEIQNKLLDLNFGILQFSIHESNTALRNGEFVHPSKAKVTKKILQYIKRAMERGENPYISVSMLPMTLDDPRVEEFRDFWLQIVSSISFYSYVDQYRTIVDKNITKGFSGKRLTCTAPWTQFVIAVDGSVLPCCWDYNHSMVMGNIFRDSFRSIWEGDLYRRLREKMLEGDLSEFPLCMECDKWITFLPPLKTVDMGKYYFFSNGSNLAYMSKDLDKELIDKRLFDLKG